LAPVLALMCMLVCVSTQQSSSIALEPDCTLVARLLDASAEPFARGTMKEVLRAQLHGRPVVIARAVRAPRPQAVDDAERRAAHASNYFRSERLLLTRANSPYLPKLYGGCWHADGMGPIADLALVEEHLRGFMDAASDMRRVGWPHRLRIAANTLRVLDLLDNFPSGDGGKTTRAVYGDLFAKQFALDVDYGVKFVDVHSFFTYSGAAFGVEHECATDGDCHAAFWTSSGVPHIMRGLRRLKPAMDDFGCDTATRHCRGLDTRTVAAALCHLLLEPLFELVAEHTPAHVLHRVRELMVSCRHPRREHRLAAGEIIRELAALAPSEGVLPPLELRNSNLTQYLLAKEQFETLRRHLLDSSDDER
jgi:hypothetical protein